MRERVKQILEWIHATLLFPLWIPVLYELCNVQGEEYGYLLYIKSILIVIPVIVTGIAVHKCKSLFAYIGVSLVSASLVLAFAWMIQPSKYGIVYVVGLGVGCGIVIIIRFRDRLRMVAMRQDCINEPFWEPSFSVLNRPSFGMLAYFVVIYVVGMAFSSKTTCDEAFFTVLIYVFVVILHVFLVETKEYLKMNRKVSGLPSKRIYGIAGGMLGFFLIFIFLVSIPSILTISMRQYTDIRTWSFGGNEMKKEIVLEVRDNNVLPMQEQFGMMIDENEEQKGLPVWVEFAFTGFALIILFLMIGAIIKEIMKIFADFREAYDENGDKIEVLDEEETAVFLKRSSVEAEDIETRNVRRKYRKLIRKHRKERPECYESPAEIEEKAGLLDNEEMQKLHIEYEAVRYGR